MEFNYCKSFHYTTGKIFFSPILNNKPFHQNNNVLIFLCVYSHTRNWIYFLFSHVLFQNGGPVGIILKFMYQVGLGFCLVSVSSSVGSVDFSIPCAVGQVEDSLWLKVTELRVREPPVSSGKTIKEKQFHDFYFRIGSHLEK